MDIYFANNKLEKNCGSEKNAIQKYGSYNARKLLQRLGELRKVVNLGKYREVFQGQGRCHELKGNRYTQLSLDLKHPFRLIFEPLGENIHKPDGGLDWNLVTAIRVLSVEDYHE